MTPAMLAAGDDMTVKIVIGVIVAVVWIVAQVLNAVTKKPEKRVPPSRPQRAPPPRQSPEPVAVPVPPERQQRQKLTRPPKLRMPSPPQPPAPVPPVTVARPVRVADPSPSVAASPLQQGPLIRALLRPRNLKKAYVISEVLRRPVALRDDGDGRG